MFRVVPASGPSRIVIGKEVITGAPAFPLVNSNPKAFALALSWKMNGCGTPEIWLNVAVTHPVLGLAPPEQKAELFEKASEEGGPEMVYADRVRLEEGAVLTTSLRLSVVMAMERDTAVVLKADCDEKPNCCRVGRRNEQGKRACCACDVTDYPGGQRRAQLRFHGSHPCERTTAAVTSVGVTARLRQSLFFGQTLS
jgi:hypothetical protein